MEKIYFSPEKNGFPQSMLDIMLPFLGSLLVAVAFKAGRQFSKECKQTRIDVDRRIGKIVGKWISK